MAPRVTDRLQLAAVVAGMLAVAAGFLPWVRRERVFPDGGTVTADAWQASSRWTLALILVAVATVLAGALLRVGARASWRVATAAPVLAVVAFAVMEHARRAAMAPVGPTSVHSVFLVGAQPHFTPADYIPRDHFTVGLGSHFGYGLGLARVLVLAQVGLLVAVAVRRRSG